MTKVFINGSAGTTGLRIYERLRDRKDIELLTLLEEKRKDPQYIKEAFKEADIAFLCLPDDAAEKAYEMAKDLRVRLIDTSTAHRVNPEWTYGFPEIKNFRKVIKAARLVANPGCHASGFLALITPLIERKLISKETALSCISLTGYSGGGKNMIQEYERKERCDFLNAPRLYGISQEHKHLKEMKAYSGITLAPEFFPIVSDYYAGMETIIPLFKKDILSGGIRRIKECYMDYYSDTEGVVVYKESLDDEGFVSGGKLAGFDDMMVTVTGNEERIVLIALFDNLGKGASGAAIQNMNIMLGVDEKMGLNLKQKVS